MKEFNLELARQGKPVCTRYGCKARIICFDYKNEGAENPYPIIALVSCTDKKRGVEYEAIVTYTIDGKYMQNSLITEEDYRDLMMNAEIEGNEF